MCISLLHTDTYKQNDIFGRVISNVCEQEIILTILGREFVIPARSTFLLSNLCQISPLYSYTGIYILLCRNKMRTQVSYPNQCFRYLYFAWFQCLRLNTQFAVRQYHAHKCLSFSTAASNGKYDLIVIDPPWENRSAIRGKKLVKHHVYHYIHIITLLVHICPASTVYMQFVCWFTMLSCRCHCHYAHCGIKKNYTVFIMSKKFVLNFYHISL